jgi:hypothetical protein
VSAIQGVPGSSPPARSYGELAREAMADGDPNRIALGREIELPAAAGGVARGHSVTRRPSRV